MASPAFFGVYTIDSDNDSVAIAGGSSDTLAHGDYYLHDPAGGAGDLMATLTAMLTTLAGSTVTVAMGATGIVTIAGASGGYVNIDAGLASALGFTDTSIGPGPTRTADHASRFVWVPGSSVGLVQTAPLTAKATREAIVTQTESLDGTVWTQRWASLQRCTADVSYVPVALAIGDYGTYDALWLSTLSVGGALCYAPSWAPSAPGVYHYYKAQAPCEWSCKRTVEGSDMYWTCSVKMVGAGLA